MAILPIAIYPDSVLREETSLVDSFGPDLHELLDDMAETMYDARGIGLAAPQISVNKRITVIDVSSERDKVMEFINPVITSSEGSQSSEEGCLSIPDYLDTITRYERVSVRAQDRHGEEFTVEAEGLLALCLQHEIDHLNGVLFVDHLSRIKRTLFKKWAKKHLKRPDESDTSSNG